MGALTMPDRHSIKHSQTQFYPNIGHTKLANGKVVMAGLQHPYHKQSCCNRGDFHAQILYHRQMSNFSCKPESTYKTWHER